jgi:PGF-CTERM protein
MFTVADPSLDIKVWDFGNTVQTNNIDATGKSIPQGDWLGFRIDTNMYPALDAKRLTFNATRDAQSMEDWVYYNNAREGYIDIKVKTESGATLIALLNSSITDNGVYATIQNQNVSYQPWTWGTAPSTWGAGSTTAANAMLQNWSTGALDANGQYAYPPGTYTITAESKLNGMKDNYKNAGADYTGKTVSQSVTITLVSDTVKIEANKDSVVRSKAFSVTVTGKPKTLYHIWVKGTASMTGGYDDQPPMIKASQAGVVQDTYQAANVPVWHNAAVDAGGYRYENAAAGVTIWNDVAGSDNVAVVTATQLANRAYLGNGTYCYANVTLSDSGTRTVEFTTNNWTKAQKYTIRVENTFDNRNSFKSDEVDIKVEKGAVTIVAAGDQSYYLGEEIKFSGTNTETYQTYLFLVGPNLWENGSDIKNNDPRRTNAAAECINENTARFQVVDVLADNTWSWKWGTSNIALDAGTYTVYAVSQPKNKANLEQAAYGTVSIIIKKPFVSATASQSTVAKGDRVYITGTAEGDPSSIAIWILGKNYAARVTESVGSDASFKYEITRTTTQNLYAGQYFVVVQHPMQNDQFDIYQNGNDVFNRQLNQAAAAGGAKIFTLLGAGSLQGSDAAEALVQGINDPNVDDTYTKLQFLIEEPIIRIDPIGDKRVGDKFTITAQTNLAVDDEILAQVYSSSFKPTQKTQSGEFSGATGTVKVVKGDSGMNKISFDVDSSTFKPDEYIVIFEAVLQGTTGTALFNVLEATAPVVTTAAPVVTTAATAVPTTVATAAPTTAPTQSPGYGALIALIGLGAVAFIVVRRH